MDTFHKDLEFGITVEKLFLSLLKNHYPDAYGIDGYFKEYDIFIPCIECGIEVKYDRRSKDTGNYFVEEKCDGKPSGINVTKSRFWAFYNGTNWVVVSTEVIRILDKGHKFDRRTFTPKNNNKKMQGFLIPIELLTKFHTVVI